MLPEKGQNVEAINISYKERKDQIRSKLNDVAEDFVIIGYHLKHIHQDNLYLEDGYNNIYEFAMKEYGISKSTTSRFIAINTKFSVGGNSPKLISTYEGYGSGKLQEMLQLDEEDCSLITEKISREEIKELKQFRREEEEYKEELHNAAIEPEEITAAEPAEPKEFISEPAQVSVNTNTNETSDLEKIITGFFNEEGKHKKRHQQMQLLQSLYNSTQELTPAAVERIAEIINPNGHDIFKKAPYFVFLYGASEGVAYTRFGTPGNFKLSYQEIWEEITQIYQFETAKDAWLEYYGQEEAIKDENQLLRSAQPLKNTSTNTKSDKVKNEHKKSGKSDPKPEENEEQLPGQMKVEDYPDLLPDNKEEIEKVQGEVIEKEDSEDTPESNKSVIESNESVSELNESVSELNESESESAENVIDTVQSVRDIANEAAEPSDECSYCRKLFPRSLVTDNYYISIKKGRLTGIMELYPKSDAMKKEPEVVSISYCPKCGKELRED